MSDNETNPQELFDEVKAGEHDYDTIHRIPASEDWLMGDEVGFVITDNWLFAVNWIDDEIVSGMFAVEDTNRGVMPSATEWMITNNDAIDYGLPEPSER